MESLRTLMFQLKINHRIITHIDFNDEGDEKVGNKTKWKCISTVINSLAIIFHWFSCRSTSSKFSRQRNVIVQSKPPESRISARPITCHFTDLNNICLCEYNSSFLYFSQFDKTAPR